MQLPWGLEAPLSVFVPSGKTLLRDRLHDLALENPELSDEGLRRAVLERFGASLSRRSIAQYRKELGLPAGGKRFSERRGPRRPSARRAGSAD